MQIQPLKFAISACLLGRLCNYKGEALGSPFLKGLQEKGIIQFHSFCPEDSALGTPRPNMRIVGGNGSDVLSGSATVLNVDGEDVTKAMIQGANHFLQFALSNDCRVAILMEGSPSCGSNVIMNSIGWPKGGLIAGEGVTAALLRRHGIQVLSSFDERKIDALLRKEVPGFEPELGLKNFEDHPAAFAIT